tara:strand:+ start:181 stop:630 length:450 start_codon:yes stop_codon:yes gene_type:complete
MADVVDGNKEYIVGTSGNYITKRKKNVLDCISPALVSNAIVLTEDMTGAVVFLPASSADTDVITLPTAPADGTNFKFIFDADQSQTYVMAGKFEGQIQDGAGIQDVASATSVSFLKTAVKKGDRITCIYKGDTWYLDGQFITAAAMSAA